MVAYYDRSQSKWFRAVVDFYVELSSTTDSYILWLIDCGYPVRAFSSSIHKLEKRFYSPETFENVLKVGCSNVLPTSEDYDYLNERPLVEIVDHWNGLTVSKLQKIVESSYGIEFYEKTRFKDQLFGEVKIYTNTGKILDLCNVLVKSPNAVQVDDNQEFIQKLKYLETINVERYQDNNRQCMKTPEQMPKTQAETSKPNRGSSEMPSLSKQVSRSLETASTVSSNTAITVSTSSSSFSDDPDEMPLLVTSSYETESEISKTESQSMTFPEIPNQSTADDTSEIEFYSCGSDSLSEKPTNEQPFSRSKKISMILERLNQRKVAKATETIPETANTNTESNHDPKPGPKVIFMPACYDQVLGQAARAKNAKSPPKSTSSSETSTSSKKKPKGMSRLDKILALHKSPPTKKGPTGPTISTTTASTSTTTTTSTTANDFITAREISFATPSTSVSSVEEATPRLKLIQKVQLATVTQIDSHSMIKCRQNVKHRDDDERLVFLRKLINYNIIFLPMF